MIDRVTASLSASLARSGTGRFNLKYVAVTGTARIKMMVDGTRTADRANWPGGRLAEPPSHYLRRLPRSESPVSVVTRTSPSRAGSESPVPASGGSRPVAGTELRDAALAAALRAI